MISNNTNKYICNKIVNISNNLITLTELKTFLRVDADNDDNLIQDLLQTAFCQAELSISKIISPKRYEIKQQGIPNIITLPCKPIICVNSVMMIDNNDIEVECLQHSYNSFLNTVHIEYPSIYFKSIIINFDAGISDVNNFNNLLKTAIMGHVLFMYENRQSISIPPMSWSIYSKFRDLRI